MESLLLENKVEDFVGDLKVYDYDKDRQEKPNEKNIVFKVKTSSEERAREYAKLFGGDSYRIMSGNNVKHFVPDPVDPEEIYLKLEKIN